jgi:phage tail sheath protein FI
MPIPLTYPGVYIEEVPSGVHTITGVPTSIAAFVGPAVSGPANEPRTIFSYADYTNVFGGLDVHYPLSYAVRDFFANGGGQAIIVRVVSNDADDPATRSTFGIPTSLGPGTGTGTGSGGGGGGATGTGAIGLLLTAANQGNWAHSLYVQVNQDGLSPSATDPATQFGLENNGQLFNLKVGRRKTPDGTVADIVEEFRNLTTEANSPRYIQTVLAAQSNFLRLADTADIIEHDPRRLGQGAVQGSTADDKSSSLTPGDYYADPDPNDHEKKGIAALDKADIFNLLCLPMKADEDVPSGVLSEALAFCVRRRAMLILDPPQAWADSGAGSVLPFSDGFSSLSGPATRNAAVYYPRLNQPNPLKEGAVEKFVPSGAVAGLYAATDAARGVWKAPAGVDAGITGIDSLTRVLTDSENGVLNPLGINCLRTFPVIGTVVWGARTLRGADQLGDEYKYVPVRRTALFIEESLYRGTKWIVFEPNDERLWSQIRLNVGAFMHDLFRQGAFQGQSAQEAYFVKCDKETTLQNDIDHGIVNILVGFAPLKPAEFVVIKIQQMAGQIAV